MAIRAVIRAVIHVAIRAVIHVAIRAVIHVAIRAVIHVAIRAVIHVAIRAVILSLGWVQLSWLLLQVLNMDDDQSRLGLDHRNMTT